MVDLPGPRQSAIATDSPCEGGLSIYLVRWAGIALASYFPFSKGEARAAQISGILAGSDADAAVGILAPPAAGFQSSSKILYKSQCRWRAGILLLRSREIHAPSIQRVMVAARSERCWTAPRWAGQVVWLWEFSGGRSFSIPPLVT